MPSGVESTAGWIFDVTMNVALAFAVCAAIVLVLVRITRRWEGSWQIGLLAIPFAKAVFELGRGIPEHGFHWAYARGVSQDHGSFDVGIGLAHARVAFRAALVAVADGVKYPTSAADLIARALHARGLSWLPAAVGVTVVAVAACFIARRIVGALSFEHRRRRERRTTHAKRIASPLAMTLRWKRRVDVYVAQGLGATTPFAGGVIHPYVCFPESVWSELDEKERTAALAHELAHVERLDVVWLTAFTLARDICWFCPGAERLHRAIGSLIERAADDHAIRNGASAAQLASAIVRVAELAVVREHEPAGFVATFRPGRATARRVRHLLREWDPPSRADISVRLVFVALTATSLISAVFLGNH